MPQQNQWMCKQQHMAIFIWLKYILLCLRLLGDFMAPDKHTCAKVDGVVKVMLC